MFMSSPFSRITLAVLLALGGSGFALAAPPTVGSNVQIGVAADVASMSLGIDPASGRLYALLRHLGGNLSLYNSTNGGASWGSSFGLAAAATASDLVVVGGYGYICTAANGDLRVRRFAAATGAIDGTYGTKTLLDDPPSPIVEVAAAGNGDDANDLFACAALLDSGMVRFFYASAAAGTPFAEAPPGIDDADSGLALAWRTGAAVSDTRALLLSYVSTLDELWVYGLDISGWDDGTIVAAPTYAAEETSLSSFGDEIVVVFEEQGDLGSNIDYRGSHLAGSAWFGGNLCEASASTDYYAPLVSARSGTGVAVLAHRDALDLDSLLFYERRDYGGYWTDPVALNDHDFSTNGAGFDFDWLEAGWGFAYRDSSNRAWFAFSRTIRYSGFESGDLSEWSAAVGGS